MTNSARRNLRRLRALFRLPKRQVPVLISTKSVVAIACALAAVLVTLLFVDTTLPRPGTGFTHEIRVMFWSITDLGRSAWMLVPTGLVLLAALFIDRRRLLSTHASRYDWLLSASTLIFLSVAGSGLLVMVLKRLVGRARPWHFETHGPYAFEPFQLSSDFASFPSGHSTSIGTFAMAVAILFPIMRIPVLLVAAAVAISRYMGGVHYPADVLAGLMLGMAFAWFVARWMFSRNLAIFPNMARSPAQNGMSKTEAKSIDRVSG